MDHILKPLSRVTIILLITFSCAIYALAQTGNSSEATKADKNGIASVFFADIPPNDLYLRVDMADQLDSGSVNADMAPANLTIKFLPSGKTVPVAQIDKAVTSALTATATTTYDFMAVFVALKNAPEATPLPSDNQVQIEFTVLHFKGNVVKKNVAKTGLIYNAANINDLVNGTRDILKQAVAHAKTDDEKDIFAGFQIVVPSGSAKTQGDGDISLNKSLYAIPVGRGTLFDELNFGLHIKKATQETADARHFEMGLTFRKTFLRHRDKILAVADAINRTAPGATAMADTSTMVKLRNHLSTTKPEQIISDLQQDFFRGFLWDNGFQFEGDVKGFSIGNVSNLLYNTQLHVTTVSRAIGNRAGFWNFRLIPAGLEVGYNINNGDNKSKERQSLARLKAGAALNLFYQAENPNDLLNRVELSIQGVDRYLLRRESAFDDNTKKAILVEKGNRYWLQSDLKFMFGPRTPIGSVGIKIGFRRGSLPPVYAFNKAFNIGLLFETGNKDTSKEIKLK